MRTFSLNINGKLIEYNRPAVMGILNVTPDSFYRDSRAQDFDAITEKVKIMVAEGVDIIDVGAYSTRPGHQDVPIDEELRRLEVGLKALRAVAPDIPVSIDTFRAEVAKYAVRDLTASIINDITGGADTMMFDTVAKLNVPYVLTHNGNGHCIDDDTLLPTVLKEVAEKYVNLCTLGVNDIIIDPGFGFGKTLEQNYQLLNNLSLFGILHVPILVGVSRKSMITRLLNTEPEDSLTGTTTINTIALQHGASILRVHDVAPAVQAVKIFTQLNKFECSNV